MPLQKLATTDAFVVVDIPDAPATGPVRMGRKILQSSATDLARSITYMFAICEMQRSGASGGINAEGNATAAAVNAFVEELTEVVAGGGLHLDPAKGLTASEFAPFTAVDSRNRAGTEPAVQASGVLAATEWALGGTVDGKRIAIEGSPGDPIVSAVRSTLEAAGALIVTPEGIADRPWMIWGAEVDAICAGSKPGTLTHQGAEMVKASAIVPWGPIPVTTKAFAQLRRSGVQVLPDFISASGQTVGGYMDGDTTMVSEQVAVQVSGMLGGLSGHEDGVLLAACYQAEQFLKTWTEAKIFGRPLAA